MICNVIVPCPLSRMTVRESLEAFGQEGGMLPVDDADKPRGMSAAQWVQVKARKQRERDIENESFADAGRMIACGGKTCDLALCGCCRESIGEERDLCRIHAAQFRGAERVTPRFSKPRVVK